MTTDALVNHAEQVFRDYRKIRSADRALFLRAIATNIENLGDSLIQTVHTETNLPPGRLEGERGRTCNQLRMFASLLEEGSWVEAIIETAMPDRVPVPRPDLRRMLVPVGPVVVFGACNFPLAFSTAGGDTASALASGCPVIFKGHPAQPRTSLMVASAISAAAEESAMPAGVFQHVDGGIEEGQALVKHPKIKAVAFTGSYAGGMAIFKTAMSRPEPIPVFAEMGSVNPIFILPDKMSTDYKRLAQTIAQSVLQGVGQFCTSPGLVFVPHHENTNDFIEVMKTSFLESPEEKMLHQQISVGYMDSLGAVLSEKGVQTLVHRQVEVPFGPPALGLTTIEHWVKNPLLQQEVFGPFTLLVEYKSVTQLHDALFRLHGQLTCSIHASREELLSDSDLVHLAQGKCGRILFDGVPTGVEVGHAMTHGGPFPSTTDSRSTSVGTAAIKRFVRPVTYQSAPQEILPDVLRNENPSHIVRWVNGEYTRDAI
jgi:2,5-dioxopentanoate dehydrogenase